MTWGKKLRIYDEKKEEKEKRKKRKKEEEKGKKKKGRRKRKWERSMKSRPDVTFVVDWAALKVKYYQSFSENEHSSFESCYNLSEAAF